MKRSKEFLLWTFFLAVCFWAGYLKGVLPLTFKQSLFIKGPVRITNAAPFDFPPEFLKTLEEDFGQKIEVHRSQDWNDLQAKLVTKTGPHLVLVPIYWARDFAREGLLLSLKPLERQIEQRLAPDFLSLQGEQNNALPLYWTITEFRVHRESPLGERLTEALTHKDLNEVRLFPDRTLMSHHLKDWENQPKIAPLKIKEIKTYHFRGLPEEITKTAIWEVPKLAQIPQTRSLESTGNKALIIYGLIIPKNSQNPKASYRLLERLMDPEMESLALKALPLGSALRADDRALHLEKAQRSSELRNLQLHELLIPEKRDPELFQRLWQKYNFTN